MRRKRAGGRVVQESQKILLENDLGRLGPRHGLAPPAVRLGRLRFPAIAEACDRPAVRLRRRQPAARRFDEIEVEVRGPSALPSKCSTHFSIEALFPDRLRAKHDRLTFLDVDASELDDAPNDTARPPPDRSTRPLPDSIGERASRVSCHAGLGSRRVDFSYPLWNALDIRAAPSIEKAPHRAAGRLSISIAAMLGSEELPSRTNSSSRNPSVTRVSKVFRSAVAKPALIGS
jgi:hypothetical protein